MRAEFWNKAALFGDFYLTFIARVGERREGQCEQGA